MYTPPHFAGADDAPFRELLRVAPLGTLMLANDDGDVDVAEAPCVHDPSRRSLEFHLAKQNPFARRLEHEAREVLLKFSGPDAYVSPLWYERPQTQVPTWNYVTVLARGRATAVTDPVELTELLERLTRAFEPAHSTWSIGLLSERLRTAMLREIVGFRVEISNVQTKLKLSQNRSSSDRARVLAALAEGGSSKERDVASWMERWPTKAETER